MNQETDRPGPPLDPAAVFAALAFPVEAWATRPGTWGSHHLGGAAVLGAVAWPPLFIVLYGPDPGLGWVVRFWLATFVWLLAHRVRGLLLRRRGYRCHSRFWGESRFERGGDLAAVKRARLLCVLVAAAVGLAVAAGLSRPLGTLLLVGAGAKLVADAAAFAAVEDRLRQMADARLETEFYVGLFRERHDR